MAIPPVERALVRARKISEWAGFSPVRRVWHSMPECTNCGRPDPDKTGLTTHCSYCCGPCKKCHGRFVVPHSKAGWSALRMAGGDGLEDFGWRDVHCRKCASKRFGSPGIICLRVLLYAAVGFGVAWFFA